MRWIALSLLWGLATTSGFPIVYEDEGNDTHLTHLAATEVLKYAKKSGWGLDASTVSSKTEDGGGFRVVIGTPLTLGGLVTFKTDDDHTVIIAKENITIVGATKIAALYGAYTFCEKAFGIKYTITRDVVPYVPNIDLSPRVISMSPDFAVRGLQPFHDFNSGPDWWNLNDFRVHLTQMAKLKLNFIGFHSYPMQEPLAWVGTKENVSDDGKVKVDGAYPTSYRTTQDFGWGLIPRDTKSYTAGAADLFTEKGCYGSPVQDKYDYCLPRSDAEQAEIFDTTLQLFTDAVRHAKHLGIKTAIGTEVPLTKPAGLSAEQAFEGLFKRLDTTGIDYYWHWTAEGGSTVNSSITQQAVKDVHASFPAMKTVNASFKVALCGWLIGPQDDPTYFDRVYGDQISALSALDLGVGWNPMQPEYAEIKNHPTWVIPWMEDDPGLIGAELWVNRTLNHLADARKYNTSGVLGIHWRTLEPSLSTSAMARGMWDPTLTLDQFYKDFADAGFAGAQPEAAELLASVDSFAVGPEKVKVCWTGGIGDGCVPHIPRPGLGCCASWGQVDLPDIPTDYKFADDFAALRSRLKDPSSLEVFDEWADQFIYQKNLAEVQMATWQLYINVTNASKVTDPSARRALAKQAIPQLAAVSRSYEIMMERLLAFSHTPGEMGMLTQQEGMNWMRDIMVIVYELQQYLADPTESALVGCYKDMADVHAMVHGPGIVGHSNPHYGRQNCSQVCAEYEYFAVQQTACFCSNDLSSATQYGATTCPPEGGAPLVNALYKHTPQEILPASVWPSQEYRGPSRLYIMNPLTVTPHGAYVVQAVCQAKTALQPKAINLYYKEAGASSFTHTVVPQTYGFRYTVHTEIPSSVVSVEYYIEAKVGSETLRYPPNDVVSVSTYAE